YSTYGPHVALTAPGLGVPGWCDGAKVRYCVQGQGGTSSATALASASAALIWSKHPEWTSNQVLRVLIKTTGRSQKGRSVRSKYIGYGAVRPRANLLQGKGDPGDPDISPLTGKKTLNTKAKKSAEKEAEKDAPDKVTVTDSSSGDGDNNNQLYLILGIVGGVVIVAGGVFGLARVRRN
ncbi:S8 family serine peptidase, partial [Streptomyces boncukensis]